MMDDFEYDPEETFAVNVEEVIANKALMPITRKLAKKIQLDGYVTVGDFIIQVGDEELEDLVALATDALNDDHELYDIKEGTKEFILLSMLIALGEGLDDANSENILARATFFSRLIVFESLYRKGFINAYHENWTLDLDINNDDVLVEAIPGVTPTSEEFRKMMGYDPDDQ